MNYLFQMRGRTPDRPLDYSRWALPVARREHTWSKARASSAAPTPARSAAAAAEWPHTAFYRWTGQLRRAQRAHGRRDRLGRHPGHDRHLGRRPRRQLLLGHAQAGAEVLRGLAGHPYSFRDQPEAGDAPTYQGANAQAHEETDDAISRRGRALRRRRQRRQRPRRRLPDDRRQRRRRRQRQRLRRRLRDRP